MYKVSGKREHRRRINEEENRRQGHRREASIYTREFVLNLKVEGHRKIKE
jgi:hypothetical protein